MREKYIIDASIGVRDGMFCVCPIEFDDLGNVASIMTGLNILVHTAGDLEIVGVFHPNGQEAVDEFCKDYEADLDRFYAEPKP